MFAGNYECSTQLDPFLCKICNRFSSCFLLKLAIHQKLKCAGAVPLINSRQFLCGFETASIVTQLKHKINCTKLQLGGKFPEVFKNQCNSVVVPVNLARKYDVRTHACKKRGPSDLKRGTVASHSNDCIVQYKRNAVPESKTNKSYEMYYADNYTHKRYHCAICSFRNGTSAELEAHTEAIHKMSMTSFQCCLCSFRCTNKLIILEHQKEHLAPAPVPKKVVVEAALTAANHLRTSGLNSSTSRTKDKRWRCETCRFCSDNRAEFEAHTASAHKARLTSFSCPVCYFKSHSKLELSQHLETHSAPAPTVKKIYMRPLNRVDKDGQSISKQTVSFPCILCPFEATSQKDIDEHQENHFEHVRSIKQFQCGYCGFVTTEKDVLDQHLLNSSTSHSNLPQSGQSIYKKLESMCCSQCDFRSFDRISYRRHLKQHSRETTD